MNFLAHLFLSHHDPHLAIGNIIADFIKNKEVPDFSVEIQQGVELHRLIDSYTDAHPLVRKGTKRLRPTQGKYAPVVLDILFDHLLAKNWDRYADETLEDFASQQYILLENHLEIMPKKLKKNLPNMIEGNWLVAYGWEKGIRYTLKRMDERTKFPSAFSTAFDELKAHYSIFNQEFNSFFPDIIKETKSFIAKNE